MRKTIVFLMIFAVVCSMGLCAHAADSGMDLDLTQPEAGGIVYVTVSLEESLTGDAMGLTFEYDKTALTLVTEDFEWVKDGTLSDFRFSKRQGVWASAEAMDLKGAVCILAFQISGDFTQSEVVINLVVQNGPEVTGQFQSSATIRIPCSHNYGSWEDMGDIGHVRVCEKCNEQQTQSHTWEEASVTADPDKPGFDIHTEICTVCAAVKEQRMPAEHQESMPSYPALDPPESVPPTEQMPEPMPSQPSVPEETTQTVPIPQPTEHPEYPEPTKNPDYETQPTSAEQETQGGQFQEGFSETETTEGPQDHTEFNDAPELPKEETTASRPDSSQVPDASAPQNEPKGMHGSVLLVAVALLAAAVWTIRYRRRKEKNDAQADGE